MGPLLSILFFSLLSFSTAAVQPHTCDGALAEPKTSAKVPLTEFEIVAFLTGLSTSLSPGEANAEILSFYLGSRDRISPGLAFRMLQNVRPTPKSVTGNGQFFRFMHDYYVTQIMVDSLMTDYASTLSLNNKIRLLGFVKDTEQRVALSRKHSVL